MENINIKLNKKTLRGLAIVLIVLVVFNVLAFAVPFEKTSVFWLSYAFSMIAILFQTAFFIKGFENGKTLKSKLYKFPIIRISVIYLALQLTISFIAMIFAAYIPLWLVFIVYVLIVAAASVGLIATTAMSEELEKQDVVLEKNVSNMRNLQSKSRYIAKQCLNTSAKEATEKLADLFKYSDPVSSGSITELENELSIYLDEIQSTITDEDYSCTIAFCQKAEIMLAERNRLCKLNKNK